MTLYACFHFSDIYKSANLHYLHKISKMKGQSEKRKIPVSVRKSPRLENKKKVGQGNSPPQEKKVLKVGHGKSPFLQKKNLNVMHVKSPLQEKKNKVGHGKSPLLEKRNLKVGHGKSPLLEKKNSKVEERKGPLFVKKSSKVEQGKISLLEKNKMKAGQEKSSLVETKNLQVEKRKSPHMEQENLQGALKSEIKEDNIQPKKTLITNKAFVNAFTGARTVSERLHFGTRPTTRSQTKTKASDNPHKLDVIVDQAQMEKAVQELQTLATDEQIQHETQLEV